MLTVDSRCVTNTTQMPRPASERGSSSATPRKTHQVSTRSLQSLFETNFFPCYCKSSNSNLSVNQMSSVATDPPLRSPVPSIGQTSQLQAVNYSNALAFILNLGITYYTATSDTLPSNGELSRKYQTLVTPAGYAFSIWSIIFMAQFVWSLVLQLLPTFRSSDWVVKGVGYWYVFVCIAQCTWSIVFALEWIYMSLIAMLLILLGLVVIVLKLSLLEALNADTNSTSTKLKIFWGFIFPFQIHCGWIWAASLVNANLVLVANESPAAVQVFCAWLSLAALALVAFYYLHKQIFVVPCVAAWASFAIRVELFQEVDLIVQTFDASTIEQVRFAATSLAILISLGVLVKAVMVLKYSNSSISSNPEDSSEGDEYSAMRAHA